MGRKDKKAHNWRRKKHFISVTLLYVHRIGSLSWGDCHFVSTANHGDIKRIGGKGLVEES